MTDQVHQEPLDRPVPRNYHRPRMHEPPAGTPRFGTKVYLPGQTNNLIIDYAHDAACDGTCTLWKDEFLATQLFPEEKICFPTFDEVYGNCNMNRTKYELCHKVSPDIAFQARGARELKMMLHALPAPAKQTSTGIVQPLFVNRD